MRPLRPETPSQPPWFSTSGTEDVAYYCAVGDPGTGVHRASGTTMGRRGAVDRLGGVDPVAVLGAERDRAKGIWPEPLRQPARPAAVLILRGIWLGCHDATAQLWLPPGTSSPLLPWPWTVRTIGPDGQPDTVEETSGTAADHLNPSR